MRDLLILTHEACLDHDMGEGHPECPDRLRAVWPALGDAPRENAPRATPEQLARVHPAKYIEAILAIRPQGDDRVALDADTIMSAGSAEAALRAVIEQLKAGDIQEAMFTPDLGRRLNSQMNTFSPLVQGFGDLQTIEPSGVDDGVAQYLVTFDNAATQ